MFAVRSPFVSRSLVVGLALGALASCGGDGGPGGDPRAGAKCEVTAQRVELLNIYRPPSGRPLTFPADLAAWKIEGAKGELVQPTTGEQTQPALRMTVTGNTTITFPGPHDLAKLEALAFIAWVVPKRAIQARISARSAEQVWAGTLGGPAMEGEGWQLFRAALPPDAVQSGHADELKLELTGEVAGDLAIETPVLEWTVAPPWKALLDGDLAQPKSIELSNGARTGYALAAGRIFRGQATLPSDGGHIVFAHSTIEPARGKPTLGYFMTTIQHGDGRVGQIRTKIETRNKWFDDKPVAFQGKKGETIQIAIELMVEGPGALCAAIADVEVFAP